MRNFLSRFALLLGIIGVCILYKGGADGIAALRTAVDLYDYDTDFNELSRFDGVHATIDFSYCCFVEEETTTKNKYGSVTNRSYQYYYAIPVYSGEDMYIAGIKVPQSAERTLDKIVDETWEYVYEEADDYGYTTYENTGRFVKMVDESFKYMKETFQEMGMYDEEIEQYLVPYYLKPYDRKTALIMFFIGVGCTFIGLLWIFILIKSILPQKKKNTYSPGPTSSPTVQNITINGNTYPKSYFDYINQNIINNNIEYAQQDLAQLTGVSPEEAAEIIRNWRNYYN